MKYFCTIPVYHMIRLKSMVWYRQFYLLPQHLLSHLPSKVYWFAGKFLRFFLMFFKASAEFTSCFTHIGEVTVFAQDFVDAICLISWIDFVFGVDKNFPKGSMWSHSSWYTMLLENSARSFWKPLDMGITTIPPLLWELSFCFWSCCLYALHSFPHFVKSPLRVVTHAQCPLDSNLLF